MARPRKNNQESDFQMEGFDPNETVSEPSEVSNDVAQAHKGSESEFIEPVRGEIVTEDSVSELVDQNKSEVQEKVNETVPESHEEKIPEGWMHIDKAPLVGVRVHLMNPEGDPVLAFWKTTRQFVSGHWKTAGKWVDAVTGKVIGFEPEFWREGQ